MNLISFSFLTFVLLTAVLYFLLPGKARPYWLLLASLYFYACSDLRYFAFIGLSVIISFFAALAAERYKGRGSAILTAAVAVNVAVLSLIKLLPSTVSLAESLFKIEFPDFSMLVPLGIAFYTLQAVSYCVDVKRGKYAAERNFFKFLLYMTYFPIILQGPISRYDQLAPQLFEAHCFDWDRVKSGLQLGTWGFFKKLVIADRAAMLVNTVFSDITVQSGAALAFSVFVYSIQIYADFSGCVDICRGVSQIYGIGLAENFRRPYFSTSINDFWDRWHISLSTWLRDYIYFPLGGGRRGTVRRYINILIVFIVSGLWHGTGAHFLLWGLMHAVMRIIGALTQKPKERLYSALHVNNTRFLKLIQMLCTFVLVSYAWLYFRAATVGQALDITRTVFTAFDLRGFIGGGWLNMGLDKYDMIVLAVSTLILLLASAVQTRRSLRSSIAKLPLPLRWGVYLAGILSIVIFGIYGPGFAESQFIYMQF